ncbi:hypothetical protein HF325_001085 [Metschnikowia pulcherrima]|uniref:Peroxisomal membrane protein PEX13 n=1 Tax=Metschnikowia pulcherrima TaxID=27326 RepID=A0A8H7GVW8_9ASCO|nr:hypothetical protein HF325_001085 [Metschnikowia pulcherrima]
MSAPRTKPWEVSSGTSAASTTAADTLAHLAAPAAVPERPSSLSDQDTTMGFGGAGMSSSYGGSGGYGSGYGSSRYGGGYGSSMYGGGGLGTSMYGNSYGSGMYGGYGGYGSSMYGGHGAGMYGSGYGGGMYGQAGMNGMNGMNGPGGLAEGTQATFQLIESIIGAVGGFAQMLEATYMATHSSFFTMVSLAEQFGNLKNTLGSLLGIFALIKFVKKILFKITGKPYNHGLNLKEFSKFELGQKKLEDKIRRQQTGATKPARISFKPLLVFLAASIGFPYLLSKAIQTLNMQQQRQQQRRLQDQQGMAAGTRGPIDPDSLEFAKALYEFNPENPNIEIELKPKELVAILSKLDPLGNESKWWKVRSRTGKVGYVPLNFLSIIERRPVKQVEAAPQITPVTADSPKHVKFVEEFNEMH